MARRLSRVALGAAMLALLTACAGGTPSEERVSASPVEIAGRPVPAEVGHVHGLGVDPKDGAVLVAGHTGLYAATRDGYEKRGPTLDLMGFTVVGPGHYLASGHPQPGSDLPQPLGLVESRDGGETWAALSRGGESDFHALTVSGGGAVGFDGALRRSEDRREWTDVTSGFDVVSLTGATSDERVVASSATAILASSDGGQTWSTVPDAPAPALLSRAGDSVYAITADGQVHRSDATGSAWSELALLAPGPVAFVAAGTGADVDVVVLTEKGLLVSRGGGPFRAWEPPA